MGKQVGENPLGDKMINPIRAQWQEGRQREKKEKKKSEVCLG